MFASPATFPAPHPLPLFLEPFFVAPKLLKQYIYDFPFPPLLPHFPLSTTAATLCALCCQGPLLRRDSANSTKLVFRVVLMGRSSVDVQAEEQVKDALAERDVVVIFSKTYCGFCAAVKRLFERLGIRYRALELDILPLGSAMQRILYEMTGQRTVPSVWVRGRHLGGNDAVQELHRTGRLLPLLDESGIAHA